MKKSLRILKILKLHLVIVEGEGMGDWIRIVDIKGQLVECLDPAILKHERHDPLLVVVKEIDVERNILRCSDCCGLFLNNWVEVANQT